MKQIYKRVAIVVILFTFTTVISAFFIYRAYSDLNNELIRRISLVLGQAVEETLTNAADKSLEKLTSRERNRLRALMNSMTTETGSIIHILLINDKMRILLSSDKSIEGHEYKSAKELANFQGTEPMVKEKVWESGEEVVDVIIPLQNKDGQVFSFIRLILSQKELRNFYQDLSYIFLPVVGIFILLIFFAVYFISRAYSQPLESIKKLATSLNEGDYSYRINYNNKDEFTDTFVRLNKTIEKVSTMNESYKKAEKRIASLLKAVDDSIVLIDNNGEVSSFNEASVKLFRCENGDEFSAYFRNLKAQNREFARWIKISQVQGKEIKNQEIALWLPDGKDLVIRMSSQVFKENERISAILFTFKDLQMLNELQNNLQRSMKFGVIANLASSISHEIKNPLSAMAIHAEILNTRIRKIELDDEKKVHKSLDVLQNEVKRLNRIINQFLNLASIKKTDLSLIKINSVIKDVLMLVQQQAIERNINIKSQLDETIDFIYGDPDQLKQVILNIIINGFQAIDRDGTVYIRTRAEHKRIFVEIQDTGIGMPSEVQKRLFDLYFSTKRDGGGIGLAVSRNIMQVHEGRISFKSAVGKGTVFTLDFPRKDKTTQINIPAHRRSK